MRTSLLWLALVLAAALPVRAVSAEDPDPIGTKVDAFVQRVMPEMGIPGLSVAVVRKGRVVKTAGYGRADVENDVPAKPETVYLLASVTKPLTAMAILMLVEDGKLALDDPISRYLTDAPPAWNGITIRHLLTHTGGLRDRFEGRTPEEWLLSFSTAQLYRSSRETPVDAPPGQRWQYSDQGYFLLGMILEKVSGKSYREFMAQRIFKPLDMRATTTIVQSEIVKNRASGYTREGGTLRHNHRRTDYGLVSHFGILSTVSDLAKWATALSEAKLLKRSSLEQMCTPATLRNGAPARVAGGAYGMGWFLNERNGHRIVQHGGSTGTAFWWLPDDQLAVIVLTNLEATAGGDATAIAKGIARLYAPEATWDATKPKPDPDRALTDKLRGEMLRLTAGEPDLALYTPQAGPMLKAAVRAQVPFFQSLGALKEFAYLGSRADGKAKTRFYRAVYAGLTLYYTFQLDPEGKIESFGGEPGEGP